MDQAARELHGHPHGPPLGVLDRDEGKLLGAEGLVDLHLLPFRGEALVEVPLVVEEPHPHEVEAEVARRLDVVPGEDPKPPSVDGQGAVEAVLRREVGHQGAPLRPAGLEVGPKRLPGGLDPGGVARGA